tara:strand:- start:560 stop:1321 length:762 start_codon:yes stop_codon:yes gene_type:complete
MVNAWSLAASVLDGTLDEDYPIMTKKEKDIEHSTSWYDYNRNDPDRENPFTDAFDHLMAESVTGKSPWIYESPDGGTTITRRKSGDDHTKKEVIQGNYFGDKYPYVGSGNTASDYPSEFTTFSDNDDQIAHHVGANPYSHFNYEPKSAHYYKYHEEEILKDIEEYVSSTYNGHYTGTQHEFRNVQTIDLMASRDLASDFCQANILKYGSRYGSKDGKNKKDLLKVIHYAMLLLHFDGHYGEPSMPSGNFDQMP